jgi:hypothetical protein
MAYSYNQDVKSMFAKLSFRAALPVAVAIGLVSAGGALAQSRRSSGLSTVGRMNSVGTGSSYDFSSHSYGLSGTSRSAGGFGSNPLQSNIQAGRGLSINRGTTISPAGSLMDAPAGAPRTDRNWGGNIAKIDVTPAPSGATMNVAARVEMMSQGASGAASLFVAAIGSGGSVLDDSSQTLVSLVPREPSVYRDYMEKGENFLKSGDADAALREFRHANDMRPRDPETWLSLLHASFARAKNAYHVPAYYLRMAMERFPELPLVSLEPKAFFISESAFDQHVSQLEKHIESSPRDANALIVQAYVQWFGGQAEEAAQTLRRAAVASQEDEKTLEAIETFWAGMLADGRVKGSLRPGQEQSSSREEVEVDASPQAPTSGPADSNRD